MKNRKYSRFNLVKISLAIPLIALLIYTGYVTYQIKSLENRSSNMFEKTPQMQYVIITDDIESYTHSKLYSIKKLRFQSLF